MMVLHARRTRFEKRRGLWSDYQSSQQLLSYKSTEKLHSIPDEAEAEDLHSGFKNKKPLTEAFLFFLSDYVAVYFYSHSWQIRKTGKENSPNLWGFEATTFASSIPVHFLSLAMVAKAERIEKFLGKFVFCLISQCAKYDRVE